MLDPGIVITLHLYIANSLLNKRSYVYRMPLQNSKSQRHMTNLSQSLAHRKMPTLIYRPTPLEPRYRSQALSYSANARTDTPTASRFEPNT